MKLGLKSHTVVHDLPSFTRDEVSQHRTRDDCWIIVRGEVYNVTSWLDKHPGGAKLLLNHAGEDVTVSDCAVI